jgi:uncharacterized membrane protein YecN with MAPEG domain
MAIPVVTPLYAAFLGLLLLVLAWNVVKQRRIHKVGLGDGGIPALSRAIRVHANFVEYVPLTLVLVLLVELQLQGAHLWVAHGLGGALLLGRVLHAIGLNGSAGTSFGRMWGTLLTWLALLAASALLVWRWVMITLL